ncbi:MAG: hypothetical protein V2A58_06370, partial [Planctomycetota bacterium]
MAIAPHERPVLIVVLAEKALADPKEARLAARGIAKPGGVLERIIERTTGASPGASLPVRCALNMGENVRNLSAVRTLVAKEARSLGFQLADSRRFAVRRRTLTHETLGDVAVVTVAQLAPTKPAGGPPASTEEVEELAGALLSGETAAAHVEEAGEEAVPGVKEPVRM